MTRPALPPDPQRARFDAAMARPEDALDLDEAALLVATVGKPELDVDGWLRQLDSIAEEGRAAVEGAGDDAARLRALCAFVFGDLGLRGDREDYHDPRNSYLDDVLSRRTGLPITLAVVLIELGRRLGVRLEPVGFPAHFLARTPGEPGVFVDAFHGGRLLDAGDCEDLLEVLSGGALAFEPRFLEPVAKRDVVVRMLRNLKGAYVRRRELGLAVRAVDRVLALDPDALLELRDRGLLWGQLGVWPRAVADLERYLDAAPDAPDRDEVARRLERARSGLWSLN